MSAAAEKSLFAVLASLFCLCLMHGPEQPRAAAAPAGAKLCAPPGHAGPTVKAQSCPGTVAALFRIPSTPLSAAAFAPREAAALFTLHARYYLFRTGLSPPAAPFA